MNSTALAEVCARLEPQMIAQRRDFHRHPESGWLEFRTTAILAKTLEQVGLSLVMGSSLVNLEQLLGYPSQTDIEAAMERAIAEGADADYVARTQGYTGLCASFDTGRAGPVVAYRFDIDCNEVPESDSETHRPFREGFSSLHAQECHACGHDGHASIGLALAQLLYQHRALLRGQFKFIFQPAEEGVRGGKAIAASGILSDVDALFGGHIGFGAQENHLIVTNVNGFLATTKLDAYITGLACHAGASPQEGHNALLAAACAALNIHALCQDGRGASRVNVGTLQAGSGRNVVASSAKLQIETRGETTAINETMVQNALRALRAACSTYQCTLQTQVVGGALGANSDIELSQIVAAAAQDLLPDCTLSSGHTLGGSEDFTFMMAAVQAQEGKATYSMFGCEIDAPHHNPSFDFDESVLLKALKVHAACAFRLNAI